MQCTVNTRATQSDGQITLKHILSLGKQDNLGHGTGPMLFRKANRRWMMTSEKI